MRIISYKTNVAIWKITAKSRKLFNFLKLGSRKIDTFSGLCHPAQLSLSSSLPAHGGVQGYQQFYDQGHLGAEESSDFAPVQGGGQGHQHDQEGAQVSHLPPETGNRVETKFCVSRA